MDYTEVFQAALGRIAPQLEGRVENVPTLPSEVADEVLRFLVTTACRGQNVRPITLARGALAAIPRDWLLERVESVVRSCLDLDDEWEYRRILECAEAIDPGVLLGRLVAIGLNSSNSDVVEAANDFRDAEWSELSEPASTSELLRDVQSTPAQPAASVSERVKAAEMTLAETRRIPPKLEPFLAW